MDKQLTQATNAMKVTTHSTFSTFSFCANLGYLPSMLSSFNWSLTPKLTITDWKEASNLFLEIEKLPNNCYLTQLTNDCYYELYSSLEELIFAVVTFVETNLLP